MELADPGAGFTTEIWTGPSCAAVAMPDAVRVVDETNVVGNALPPNVICAFLTNLLPVAVMVNAPSEMLVGEIEASTGTGFSSATTALPLSLESPLLAAVICKETDAGSAEGAV